MGSSQLTLCRFKMKFQVWTSQKCLLYLLLLNFFWQYTNRVCTPRNKIKTLGLFSPNSLLRPTRILDIPIAMYCMYNLFFHEILQAATKDILMRPTFVFFKINLSFYSELDCAVLAKEKRMMFGKNSIALRDDFGFCCYELMIKCNWMRHMRQILLINNPSNLLF